MTSRFKYRDQYDDEADAIERERTNIDPGPEPSHTQQQFTKDVNINVMMARMGLSDGSLPPASFDPRFYGDFTDTPETLTDAFARVREAKEAFDALSANIRTRFNNDPAQLIAFAMNEANREEAVKLGLLPPPKTAARADSSPAVTDTPAL